MNETFMKEKPVLPLLLSMALPNVVSMLVNSLYNIVDSLFVARISEDAMTALSLVFPIQNFSNAIAIGFGIGINAMIALYLGAGDREKAETAATHGFVLSLVHGVVMMAVSIAIMPGFLRRFTQDEELIAAGITYSTIVFLFLVVNMVSLAFEKIFQAVGRMKVSMVALITGCVCNILLDPVLIFGLGPVPAMGIAGAALATGIGQVLSVVVYLVVYLRTELPVRLRRSCLRPDAALDGRLYAIGIPAILNLALPSLLVTFLNGLLAAFSQSYVVVLGIYYKLQTFLYLPANGFVQGMRPLIGYNYGAREHARVKKLFQLTLLMSAAIMAAGTVICQVASGQLMGLFTQNPETIAAGQTALRIISIGFVISAVSTTVSGALEGLGKGTESLVISLCRYVVFIMPLAALLCNWLGADGAWHAFWLTEVLAAVVSGIVYRRAVTHKK
ncbi:MATE family efflux transporter [Faecalibacterium prausnitzii]|jgi:putative MATE family efflux protein|uniref:MATE family efflux transporter n=1 Tax=Faecalibacterium prausnitzii TaxID=853 RepID=UPI003AB0DFA2